MRASHHPPRRPPAQRADLRKALLDPECNKCPDGTAVAKPSREGTTACTGCGKVLDSCRISQEAEWRTFSNDDGAKGSTADPNRVGSASNPLTEGLQFATTADINGRTITISEGSADSKKHRQAKKVFAMHRFMDRFGSKVPVSLALRGDGALPCDTMPFSRMVDLFQPERFCLTQRHATAAAPMARLPPVCHTETRHKSHFTSSPHPLSCFVFDVLIVRVLDGASPLITPNPPPPRKVESV
jgi:hypothetical protein